MSHESDLHPKANQILDLEREILGALCASPHLAEERSTLLGALASHVWRDPEHRVVYEALLRTHGRDPDTLRSELPATATRMGFPDVEWGEYFGSADTLQLADIETRIRALAATSAKLHRQP